MDCGHPEQADISINLPPLVILRSIGPSEAEFCKRMRNVRNSTLLQRRAVQAGIEHLAPIRTQFPTWRSARP